MYKKATEGPTENNKIKTEKNCKQQIMVAWIEITNGFTQAFIGLHTFAKSTITSSRNAGAKLNCVGPGRG